MENKCAICGTGFFFSEDVQLYLAEAARVMNEKITQAARTSAAAIEAARTASPPGGDFDIQAPQEALKRADELDKKDGAPGGAQKAA